MNHSDPRKLKLTERQELTDQQSSQRQVTRFETPEDLLRYDRGQTPLPESIFQRIRENLGQLPQPSFSWWRQLWRKRS